MQKVLKLWRVPLNAAVAAYHSSTALAERWVGTVENILCGIFSNTRGTGIVCFLGFHLICVRRHAVSSIILHTNWCLVEI
jgi:hypothetical protein